MTTALSNFVETSLSSFNAEHPNWEKIQTGDGRSICIPEYFESVQANLENETTAKDYKGNRGALNEQYVYKALKKLNIGAIVVANFDMKEFSEKAGVIFKQYKEAVFRYNRIAGNPRLQENFECDFILFHPRIGIYIIEAKSVEGRIPEKAIKQVGELPVKMKLLFEVMNHGNECDVPLRTAICCPKSRISQEQSAGIHSDIIDMENLSTEEKFKQFWKYAVERCEQNDLFAKMVLKWTDLATIRSAERGVHLNGMFDVIRPAQFVCRQQRILPNICFWREAIRKSEENYLYAKTSFQRFIAVTCSFRKAVYLNGILNAVHVAQLIQEQRLFPKAKKEKALKDESRRVFQPIKDLKHSSEHVIFLTKEQQDAEMCSDQLQLISGPPGTGKTLVLLLQALKAARTPSEGRVILQVYASYKKKLQKIFDANSKEFAPGRKPIFNTKLIRLQSCDDLFWDELGGLDEINDLQGRTTCSGKTICVITGSIKPNDIYKIVKYLEPQFSAYTKHVLGIVMRGSTNIINHWRKELEYANLAIGHSIDCGVIEPPQLRATIPETLQATFDCVQSLLKRGAEPSHIAIITALSVETRWLHDFFEINSVNSVSLTRMDEHAEANDLIIIDEFHNVLSHEWPFVILCSLYCIDCRDSYMLIASSRAIVQLTIIQRDYLAVQSAVERTIYTGTKSPSLGNVALGTVVKETAKLGTMFNHAEDGEEVRILHESLTVLRLKIGFSGNKLYFSQTFRSCSNFLDCLEVIMANPALMCRFVEEFSAVYLRTVYDITTHVIVAQKSSKFIECALQLDANSTTAKKYTEFGSKYAEFANALMDENHAINRAIPISPEKAHREGRPFTGHDGVHISDSYTLSKIEEELWEWILKLMFPLLQAQINIVPLNLV